MRDRLIDPKEYAAAMRREAVRNENGIIQVSPELWEQIASLIERAIIPPCNVGDTVYRVITMGTGVHSKCIQKKSKGCYYGVSVPCEETIKKFIRSVEVTRNNFFDVIENFGKTVFLSREDAEKALEKINGNNT